MVLARIAVWEFPGAFLRHKSKHILPVNPECLARSQVICRKDDRLFKNFSLLLLSFQHCNHTFCNIFDIAAPCLEIFVFHIQKHGGKIITRPCYCIFCIHRLRQYHIFYGCVKITVIQQHGMNFKNLCLCFPYRFR